MTFCVKKVIKMAAILFWRLLLNNHLKTLIIIFLLSILLVSCGFIYYVLSTNTFIHHHRHYAGRVLDKKAYQKLHLKYKDSNSQTALEDFRKDLLFSNLIGGKIDQLQYRDLVKPGHKKILTDSLNSLYTVDWENALDVEEVALHLKYLLIDCGFESNMSCQQIDNMVIGAPVQPPETKFIEYAYDGQSEIQEKANFVIKSSFRDVEAVKECWDKLHNVGVCALKTNYRLLREVFLLSTLYHHGIIQMMGYCLRGDRVSTNLRKKGLIIVTEVGIPLSETVLASCTQSQRVSMALQVALLLLYLENTPFGSLRFKKLAMDDFVLVRGTLVKLADLDDLELGNLPCTEDLQCEIENAKRGGLCKSGFCEGLNAAINLHLATVEILMPLLWDALKHEDADLIPSLLSLDITTKELVEQLHALFKKHPPEGPVLFTQPVSEKRKTEPTKVEDYNQRRVMEREKIRSAGHSVFFTAEEEKNGSEVMSKFIRRDHENFVGLFDYYCANSQVSWGCVVTVKSLIVAADLCLQDPLCQCFVVFSGNPETESFMTVVLKNGTDATPLVFSGTTLYIRRQDTYLAEQIDSAADDNSVQWDRKQEEEVSTEISPFGVNECMSKTWEIQEIERRMREKTLMTHLGLQGVREKDWKVLSLRQITEGQKHLVKAEDKGGQFIVNFEDNSPDATDKIATEIKFISEEGPDVNHLGYAIVYQLDRILGLYHTPPCMGRRLSAETVEKYHKSRAWNSTFRSLISSDGTLSDQPILFDADRAFSSPNIDLSAYLYHCQFPVDIFQSLQCFRCGRLERNTDIGPHICSLGEEVIKLTRSMFPINTEFLVHGFGEKDLAAMINMAATTAIHIIDTCITTFGSNTVLY